MLLNGELDMRLDQHYELDHDVSRSHVLMNFYLEDDGKILNVFIYRIKFGFQILLTIACRMKRPRAN